MGELRVLSRARACLALLEITSGLKIPPNPWAGNEVSGKAQRCVGRNAAALVHNFGNSRERNSQIQRQTIHAQAQGLHENPRAESRQDGWEEEVFES
jgi:hypothetical protein